MSEPRQDLVEPAATDQYDFWRRALGGEKVGGDTLPVHDGDWQSGFYRRRASKAGAFLPVALWRTEDSGFCLVDGKAADPVEQWSYACRNPVTEANYHERIKTGRWWDEDSSVSASLAHDPQNSVDIDPAELLKNQIETASAAVETYAVVNDDETAAKAQGARSRLLELSGEADKKREALVRPFLDGQKTTNAVWMPLVKMANDGADKIRVQLAAHETRKANAATAAGLKAEEEARNAATAAQALAVADEPAPVVQPVPVLAVAVPAPSAQIRGGHGRAATVKIKKVAKVVDQDLAYMAMKTHKEIVELIAQLAQRAATAGISVPGVEVTEERDVV